MKKKRKPPRKFYIWKRPITGWRLWRWVVVHSWLMQPWWRDRLRCPVCTAVGTYKPRPDPVRYLCKWCGFYEDPDRRGFAFPCGKQRVWMLKPIVKELRPCERVGDIDPWRG